MASGYGLGFFPKGVGPLDVNIAPPDAADQEPAEQRFEFKDDGSLVFVNQALDAESILIDAESNVVRDSPTQYYWGAGQTERYADRSADTDGTDARIYTISHEDGFGPCMMRPRWITAPSELLHQAPKTSYLTFVDRPDNADKVIATEPAITQTFFTVKAGLYNVRIQVRTNWGAQSFQSVMRFMRTAIGSDDVILYNTHSLRGELTERNGFNIIGGNDVSTDYELYLPDFESNGTDVFYVIGYTNDPHAGAGNARGSNALTESSHFMSWERRDS